MEHRFTLPKLYSAIQVPGMEYALRPAGWSYPNHRHPYFEFIYCVQGEIEQWVDGQMVLLQPGEAVIIPSDSYHSTSTSIDSSYFDFHFHVEADEINLVFQLSRHTLLRSSDDFAMEDWVKQFLTRFGEPLSMMSIQPNERTHDVSGSIRQSVILLQIHSTIVQFISMIASHILSAGNDWLLSASVKPSQIKLAREAAYLMEQQPEKAPSISELSRQLNVHRTYLHSCFKHVYGLSPSAYWQRKRINEARQLLQKTSLSIEEIGSRLHFSSTSHFSRTFRSMSGMSPQQFRTHNRRA
ncbi:helix-turn-helix domain-containing protein [Paenibacillus sp. NPDC056579]|uniref:AraC family transcriptional regulator n=1 Tax=unclassified Paenibacillus TaxID=185978 RepID=UPI001EF7F1BD|nr:AraC family transcriptional regulator [Paenibacillus sp. H1-7]ULL18407.1 AraC family transcriptional regulator [Paenibacillus sp. H1-7]